VLVYAITGSLFSYRLGKDLSRDELQKSEISKSASGCGLVGGIGGRWRAGHGDLRGRFHPLWFCDSMVLATLAMLTLKALEVDAMPMPVSCFGGNELQYFLPLLTLCIIEIRF